MVEAYGGFAGTSTSAIAYGAEMMDLQEHIHVETWDGSSWTEVSDLVILQEMELDRVSRNDQLDGIMFCVVTMILQVILQKQNHWNGSAWTEVA